MKPHILNLPLSSLKRLGPTLTTFLTRLVGQNKIFDLLLHKPLRVEKILICPRLFETANDSLVIIKAKVETHVKPATARQPFKVICYTPSGYVTLVFFKIFPIHNSVSLSPCNEFIISELKLDNSRYEN
jgi:RecG-like helicase